MFSATISCVDGAVERLRSFRDGKMHSHDEIFPWGATWSQRERGIVERERKIAIPACS